MIGHRQILRARGENMKPTAIIFELGDPPKAPAWDGKCAVRARLREALYEPEKALESGLFPTVYVDAEDLRTHADFRFVHGCQAHVCGPTWTQELIALGEALANAGASFVAVNAIAESWDLMVYENGDWRTFA